MDTTESIILFAVFIIVFNLIIEIFTVLFRLTGLTQEKAKTQVISMLTNSGFTTSESEIILSSRRRRKLAQVTMLFGFSFSVIIVSIVVNIFLTLNRAEVNNLFIASVVLAAVLVILLLVMRIRAVREWFDYLIEKIANRLMFGKESNIIVMIDNYRSKAMAEIYLEHVPLFLDNIRLADTKLKEKYDIQILLLRRNGDKVETIDGNTTLCPKDIIVVFGNYKNIRSVFEHPDS